MTLTIERLHEVLDYDPETGIFVWKIKLRKSLVIGTRAGSLDRFGYRTIKIDMKGYREGRLAWFYMKGSWPSPEIDHKDNNPSNNSLSNLREANSAQQKVNRSTSDRNRKYNLPKWVSRNGQNGFAAIITVNKKSRNLGTFKTPEEAHAVAAKYAKDLHGEFFNDGTTA